VLSSGAAKRANPEARYRTYHLAHIPPSSAVLAVTRQPKRELLGQVAEHLLGDTVLDAE
jgi:hypothetical protein